MSERNIEAIYPLSSMQQGLLFHSLLAPASGIYFVQCCFTLQGELHMAAYEKAWQLVVDHHPILRTVFIYENRKSPLQVVYRRVNLALQQQDWRDLPLSEHQKRLDALLQDRASLDFLEWRRQQGELVIRLTCIKIRHLRDSCIGRRYRQVSYSCR